MKNPGKYLFLDIDGVCNCFDFATSPDIELKQQVESRLGGYRTWRYWNIQLQPEMVARVRRVVEETGAQIVVSSSWRRMMDDANLETLFRFHRLNIAGKTPTLEGERRGEEIYRWLKDNAGDLRAQSYAIVDDNPSAGLGHPPFRFIQTDVRVGITDSDASALINALGGKAQVDAAQSR